MAGVQKVSNRPSNGWLLMAADGWGWPRSLRASVIRNRARSVEVFRNQQVAGSNPANGSTMQILHYLTRLRSSAMCAALITVANAVIVPSMYDCDGNPSAMRA